MLTYSRTRWIEIQQKIVDAGLNEVPYGKLSVTRTVDCTREFFDLNFETEEDETMFLLRWT